MRIGKVDIDTGIVTISFLASFWAISETLSNPSLFMLLGDFGVIVSVVGLIFFKEWARKLFLIMSVWFIVVSALFISVLPNVPLEKEQADFLPIALGARILVVIFFGTSIYYLRREDIKGLFKK